MSYIAWLISPKKTLEADRRSGQSEPSSAGQVHRTVQSVAFTKKRQGSLLVQSDSSGWTTRRTPRHTDTLLRLSQSKGFGASFGRTTRQKLRLSQSHPSDGSSFGRIFGSANHIHRSDYLRTDFLRTDHLSDESLVQPITSFGRIIFGRTFFVTNQKPSR